MNLDDLISNYLDSELSQDDDARLRSAISEDAFFREKFDASVELHMNLKEDAASIETPDKLFRETEDIIMMKILSQPPIILPKANPWQKIYRITSVAAILLLFFVFRIEDLHLGFSMGDVPTPSIGTNEGPSVQTSVQRVHNTARPAKKATGSQVVAGSEAFSGGAAAGSGLITDNKGNLEGQNINGLQPASADNDPADMLVLEKPSAVEENKSTATGWDRDEKASFTNDIGNRNLNNILGQPAASQTVMAAKPVPHGPSAQPALGFENILQNNEVQISSFMASDFYHGGMDASTDNPAANISQSVAYALNKSDRIGMEVGYTEFSYVDKAVILVPSSSTSHSGGSVEVLQSGVYHEYVEYTMKVSRQKQLFWGAAFYENTFFSKYGLSLQGRLGAGGTSDGPMGYARLFAKYEVLPGVCLTFGSDARLFYAILQNAELKDKNLRSSASLIYGLQVKF